MSLKISESALGEYLEECHEMLERLTSNLQLLEKNNDLKDAISAIYRDIHTIKGSSQLFGFIKIGQLSHVVESCLDPIRKGSIPLTPLIVDVLFKCLDIITLNLNSIKSNKKECAENSALDKTISLLIEAIENAVSGNGLVWKDIDIPPEYMPQKASMIGTPNHEIKPHVLTPATNDPSTTNDVSKKDAPIAPLSPKSQATPHIETATFGIFDDPPSPVGGAGQEVAILQSVPPVPPVPHAPSADQVSPSAPPKTGQEDLQTESIRVNVSLLDNLMNLVGELVLIRNQVLQHSKSKDEDQELGKMSQRLNVLTAELQNEVMKTRMQPIGNVVSKFTRVVRDLGRELSKKIDLEIQGTETELDKTILEAIKDPLTHIVRNAIDHGIESAADRKKAQKNETGKILIKAYHESGQVIIEVSDDGGGIDRQRILDNAVKNQVISKEMASRLNDWEILNLIFTPGFSTAKAVSNLSGRGVGMDVVKTNVERIGGIVDIQSQHGHGTTIRLKIPLTLAIVPALLVKAAQYRFAIPQSRLVELIRIDPTESSTDRIEELQGKKVLRLRNKILPLVELSEIIKITPDSNGVMSSPILNVIVLNSDKFQFGLIVSEIEDSTDIVVKPLSQFLKEISIFSGASIMGDGTVALTLDITGMAQSLMTPESKQQLNQIDLARNDSKSGHRSEECEFLMVDVCGPGHFAIPLTLVSRLEEVTKDQIEYSGNQKILRYRSQILPIISLPQFLKFETKEHENENKVKLIVVKRGDFLYGIEVNEILDILTYEAKIDIALKDRPGILGTLLAKDRVIVIIDVLQVIDQFKDRMSTNTLPGDSTTKAPSAQTSKKSGRKQQKVLVVDDSSFFRSHLSRILQEAGYSTEIACDGSDGISMIERHSSHPFDLILSDIEMPVMDGLEMIRAIRKNSATSTLPVLAISTKYGPKAVEEGLKSGFNGYFEKLNPEQLLMEIENIFAHRQESGASYAAS